MAKSNIIVMYLKIAISAHEFWEFLCLGTCKPVLYAHL